jgi:hypothetical protein
VTAPDKPIVINLNISITQEVVYRLDNKAKTLIEDRIREFSDAQDALHRRARGSRLVAVPALAQRDPAYAAARAAGSGRRAARRLSRHRRHGDSRSFRRWSTTSISSARSNIPNRRPPARRQQMAFVTGCNLILRTAPGEKYQAPDGRWLTRGQSAPTRDPRCL